MEPEIVAHIARTHAFLVDICWLLFHKIRYVFCVANLDEGLKPFLILIIRPDVWVEEKCRDPNVFLDKEINYGRGARATTAMKQHFRRGSHLSLLV